MPTVNSFQTSIDSFLGICTNTIEPIYNATGGIIGYHTIYDIPYLIRAVYLGLGLYMCFKLIISFVNALAR